MRSENKKTLLLAMQTSLPVAAGYIFTGFAMGLLAYQAGYSSWLVLILSLTVYAGTMQFVAVEIFLMSPGIMSIIASTFIIQFRHFFYGISLLDRYRNVWIAKPYMTGSLTDEAYVLHTLTQVPEDIDRGKFDAIIAVLCQSYWVIGTFSGAFLGEVFSIKIQGLEFSLLALFITSLLDSLQKSESYLPAAVGFVSAVAALVVFTPSTFMLPALALIVVLLMIFKNPILDRLPNEKVEEINEH